ncbi:hypothetical protein AGMMS50230_11680 [Spirochaetia bacterium]|nr:hypothetical protein AGMMS50230_11680 [Spirochaetia bacterium]
MGIRILEELENHKGKLAILILDFFIEYWNKYVNDSLDKTLGLLPQSNQKELEKYKEYEKILKNHIESINFAISDVSTLISKYLSDFYNYFSKGIHYLGPLREDPKPLYPFPNNDNSFDLGRKGENTAGVLFLYGQKLIKGITLPNQDEDKENNNNQISINEVVKKCLEYIGIADDI